MYVHTVRVFRVLSEVSSISYLPLLTLYKDQLKAIQLYNLARAQSIASGQYSLGPSPIVPDLGLLCDGVPGVPSWLCG